MSLENVKAFYARLANDEDFRNQIQNVKDKSECSQIVKAAGYDFTSEELEEYTSYLLELGSDNNAELRDLNEKELEAVFGGATSVLQLLPYLPILLYGVVPIKYLY
ncbi:Nif11-like leader peptide family natural product precursor [Nostoc sp. FACHB-110]|uniref:Nif11-like leader peptide family natural product precursor n=1 Tax=Nostoc sp. FACHB-110 TaxID=2692834 RepID=UPI001687C80D|nr:Nif11-like leader peptide family natural product precursor [Nostoc sp. FACHB-110]MBD2438063.1 Nif11-like leader peptide family natural product precursor [Nostoc sp. FACHB-110]